MNARAVWMVAVAVGVAGVWACGDSEKTGGGATGGAATTTTTTTYTMTTSSATGTGGAGGSIACPDFTLTPLEWSWGWQNQYTGVYSFSTLLEACGPLECYEFPGYEEHTRLVFSWDEGESIDIYRTGDADWGSGFGLRGCTDGCCELGDFFGSDFVYQSFPDNDRLQQLVASYGPPDEACGHVFNAELVERVYCAPLAEPSGGGGGAGGSGGSGGAGGNSG